MLYTWDEPLNPKYICWRPVGSGQEMKETYCIVRALPTYATEHKQCVKLVCFHCESRMARESL